MTSRRAPTAETADCIRTNGRETALSVRSKYLRAFIDIHAFVSRITSEALGARALVCAQCVRANGVFAALSEWTEPSVAFINVFTITERIASKSWLAVAVMTSEHISANSSLSTKA